MELRDYVQAVRDGRRTILVVVVLALLAGGLLAFTRTTEYRSSAKVYVATQVDSKDPDVLAQRNAIAQQRIVSYVEVLKGDVFGSRIARETGVEIDPQDITVSVVPSTSVIEVSVVDADRRRTKTVAAAYSEAAPAVIRDLEKADAGGWQVVADVIDRPQLGEPVEARSPLATLFLAGLLGLVLGTALAVLLWAVRRELSAEKVPEPA